MAKAVQLTAMRCDIADWTMSRMLTFYTYLQLAIIRLVDSLFVHVYIYWFTYSTKPKYSSGRCWKYLTRASSSPLVNPAADAGTRTPRSGRWSAAAGAPRCWRSLPTSPPPLISCEYRGRASVGEVACMWWEEEDVCAVMVEGCLMWGVRRDVEK